MGRLPIPAGLKRYLVPIWNEAHRLGWLVRDYPRRVCTAGGRLVSSAGSSGRCSFAGESSPAGSWNCGASLHGWPKPWHARSRAIARAAVPSLRARRMAAVILQNFQVGRPPAPVRSIHEWTRSPQIARLKIAEINRIEGLHEELAGLPGFQPRTTTLVPGRARSSRGSGRKT